MKTTNEILAVAFLGWVDVTQELNHEGYRYYRKTNTSCDGTVEYMVSYSDSWAFPVSDNGSGLWPDVHDKILRHYWIDVIEDAIFQNGYFGRYAELLNQYYAHIADITHDVSNLEIPYCYEARGLLYYVDFRILTALKLAEENNGTLTTR